MPRLPGIGYYAAMHSDQEADYYQADAESRALTQTARQLRQLVADLAGSLEPFPCFWGMATLQAIELEPKAAMDRDFGCVVVTPEGRICQLDLQVIEGIFGLTEEAQVEQLVEPDFTAEEFIIYAGAALTALAGEIQRRRM